MKVIHFLPQYPGRDGTSAFGTGLVPALNRLENMNASILSLRADKREAPDGVETITYPRKSRNPFSLPDELLKDLQSGIVSADGFVLHGTFSPLTAMLGRRLKSFQIPYIFVPHDPYVDELLKHHRWRKRVYWSLFEKPLIEGAECVQLLAESHERSFREVGCSVPVFTVGNGCDPKMLEDLTGEECEPGRQNLVTFQYLGRMDRNHKGLDLLLEGFARFLKGLDSRRQVRLVLSGNDWTDRVWLEGLAEGLGIADRVEFTGPRKESSIQVHAGADVVVLPSRFDGFGLTIVEAMLASRPVIVSSRAGVSSHVIRAAGGWTPEPDPDSISDALQSALSMQDSWPEMGKRNREYVISELTWDQVAEATREAYERYF